MYKSYPRQAPQFMLWPLFKTHQGVNNIKKGHELIKWGQIK